MWDLLKDSNTVKALYKIKEEFSLLSRLADYILQIIFIGYYCYSIYANLENTVLLIINIVLLVFALVYFIYTMFKEKILNKKTKRTISRFYRYSKLLIRVFTVGLSVYTVMKFKHSDLQVIITALTVISWAIQVLIEVVRFLIDRYVDMIMEGIALDKKYIDDNGGLFKFAGKTVLNNFVVNPAKEKYVEPVKEKATTLITAMKERREAKRIAKINKKLAKNSNVVELIETNKNESDGNN